MKTAKIRLMVSVVAVAMLVVGAIAWFIYEPGSVERDVGAAGPGSADSTLTVALDPDRSTVVELNDQWSITVPRGGVRTKSELTVRLGPTGGFFATAAEAIASANLTLSSGKIRNPWIATYELAEPLPEGSYLYMVSESGNGPSIFLEGADLSQRVTGMDIIAATLNPSRTVASARIEHLSIKTWFEARVKDVKGLWQDGKEFANNVSDTVSGLAGDVQHWMADYAGMRGSQPECAPFSLPNWVVSVIHVEDQNAPFLACASGAESIPEGLEVKVANNRGVGMVIYSDAPPTNVFQRWSGAGIEDPAQPIRVPARQEVTLFYSPQDIFHGVSSFTIRTAMAPEGVVDFVFDSITGVRLPDNLWSGVSAAAVDKGMATVCALDPAEGEYAPGPRRCSVLV
ncbi:MAG: hypothetical protein L0K86_01105 [Actinomycetia bacterium]|nr:hypothetical protein [Actinomycetes bacterium]